jgi:membrane-associated HD superfamily phosphohydrolase
MSEKKTGKQLRAELDLVLVKYQDSTSLLSSAALIVTLLAVIALAYFSQIDNGVERGTNIFIFYVFIVFVFCIVLIVHIIKQIRLNNSAKEIIKQL